MKHVERTITIGQRELTIYDEPSAEYLLIQPVDSHDMEEMESEITFMEEESDKPFALAAIKINKWNAELTPWPAPPVFGKIPFGDGAALTLRFITDEVIPTLTAYNKYKGIILGGYSLAGLFSLWASYQTPVFVGAVAASPSVWYKDWLDYSLSHECRAKSIYLSLGDRESHSKNKLMATVADAIVKQKEIMDAQNIKNTLEWNPGNHFTDNGKRTGKGFVWIMEQEY